MERRDTRKKGFDHERLDVYWVSQEVLVLAIRIGRRIRAEDRYLRNQLLRAATSLSLNIAEGAAEFSAGDKTRFYRFARRSCSECAAILDVCCALGYGTAVEVDEMRSLLARSSVMLLHLSRRAPTPPTTSA